jgi:hypothetical protein
MYSFALYFAVLYSTVLYCNVLFSAMHCIGQYISYIKHTCPSQLYICSDTVLYSTVLYCTVL